MRPKNWEDMQAVVDGVKAEAWSVAYRASRLPRWPGLIGALINQRRHRLLYRSMVLQRYAERLVWTRESKEACWILDQVTRALRPKVWLFLGLISSHAGFVICLLDIALARYSAARRLRREFCEA